MTTPHSVLYIRLLAEIVLHYSRQVRALTGKPTRHCRKTCAKPPINGLGRDFVSAPVAHFLDQQNVSSGSCTDDPLPSRNVRCFLLMRTFDLLLRSASCGLSQFWVEVCPLALSRYRKQKSPGSGANGQDAFASLPRALRAWADGVPVGRSHRQASAGTGRAGVHPSWHGLIDAGGDARRSRSPQRCPLGYP